MEEQIRALGRFNPEYREWRIKAHCTGDLVAVDTFFVGTLKGVGKAARPREKQEEKEAA